MYKTNIGTKYKIRKKQTKNVSTSKRFPLIFMSF